MACSNTSTCGIADRVWQLDQKIIDDQTITLFLTQTGLAEKAHFIRMYIGEVAIDECGEIDGQELWSEYLDLESDEPFHSIQFGYQRFILKYSQGSNKTKKRSLMSVVESIDLPKEWPDNEGLQKAIK